ncbi:DEAD/DEAH box helicase [Lederbergia sp. NSJ-179]|uniref:DEAD/DEAH box helicase n=1 Tax=Lederbergia sp. NSJ-179 TaxID=2931402 RepID=UPI001FD02B2F|nr:DEAD/DEAH box helicase [Lederbergia sp. NSJ-179]MCJ7843305.1 DEAD/DEAH box helicase [Lederbergia sp. NSJ-179]
MSSKFSFSPELQKFLSGRSILLQEIPFPEKIIQDHLQLGFVKETPGITTQNHTYTCHRCANKKKRLFAKFPCAHCQKECYYCRNCIMMGRVSTCTPLYSWIGPAVDWKDLLLTSETSVNIKFALGKNSPNKKPQFPSEKTTYLSWNGTLSQGQKEASDAVVKAVRSNLQFLCWAVCGAGKTEVLFAGIDEALKLKQRVCVATPRTDVVLELAPRFQKVFPHIPVAALYGGSEDRHLFTPLTVSTTHQLYRFEQAFDAMIVDEVDAFPFSYDQGLQAAVEKAAKPQSARIFLTATPSEKWQLECKYGKRDHIKIPARYHRFALPVPVFKWCGHWQKSLGKGKIPPIVKIWVQLRLEQEKQALVFLPDIHLMEKALPVFRQLDSRIESVHAEDPDRKQKVERMRKRETPLLLTTTILERGVTFPNIDVAVLGAEDDIFTESALVQISGRVGRSADFPKGNITFFHYGRTKAMIRALIHIDQMNQEARKKGLIDG